MADRKKRSPMPRRFRYAELYHAEPRVTASGKLVTENVYIGPYLCPSHSEAVYRSARLLSRLCGIVNGLCLAALLAVDGFFFYSGGKYVMIPLAASLIPAAYLLIGTFRLPKGDRRLKKDVFRYAHTRLRASGIGELCLLGIFAALTLLSVCLPVKPIFTALDLLLALLAALSVLSCVVILREMGKLRYEERINGE